MLPCAMGAPEAPGTYEADFEDFFDSVDWRHLRERLEALYRDDPVVDLILAWMGARVEYQGFPIQRSLGLPQGAPLSPTMANLMLDQTEQSAAAIPDPNAPRALGRRDDTGLLLIVSDRHALVSSRARRIQITRDDALVADAAWRELGGLLLLGAHQITTPALRHAMAADVPVHLASGSGRYQGVAWSARAGAEGAGLWLEQRTRFPDPAWTRKAASAIVMARIRHMREVLRQRQPTGFRNQRADLQEALRAAGRAQGQEQLRGIEGNATRVYLSPGRLSLVELPLQRFGRRRSGGRSALDLLRPRRGRGSAPRSLPEPLRR